MDMPQLKMKRLLEGVPELVALPSGYAIRRMLPGEEGAWAAVLSFAGDLGEWTEERALGSFNGSDRVWRDAIHIVLFAGQVVGTACVQLHDAQPDTPELGWVAVNSAHQGRGLGTAVCAAVLGFMRDQRYVSCYLTTDDHRLPAIKSYLNLGFLPAMEHESHLSRWHAVYEKLGLSLGADVL